MLHRQGSLRTVQDRDETVAGHLRVVRFPLLVHLRFCCLRLHPFAAPLTAGNTPHDDLTHSTRTAGVLNSTSTSTPHEGSSSVSPPHLSSIPIWTGCRRQFSPPCHHAPVLETITHRASLDSVCHTRLLEALLSQLIKSEQGWSLSASAPTLLTCRTTGPDACHACCSQHTRALHRRKPRRWLEVEHVADTVRRVTTLNATPPPCHQPTVTTRIDRLFQPTYSDAANRL